MKKDHIRDYAVAAFRLYASLGCPTLAQAEQKIRQQSYRRYSTCEPQRQLIKAEQAIRESCAELADIEAVEKTLLLLIENGKPHVVAAVKAIYFANPKYPLRKGEISERVLRLSLSMPASTQTVYKWLKESRQLFALLRGLRIE